jgi:hypothetical protein
MTSEAKSRLQSLEVDQLVRINKDISRTHGKYNSDGTMHRMAGDGYHYRIQRINHEGEYAVINGYTWDVRDLDLKFPDTETPKVKRVVETFDIKELM